MAVTRRVTRKRKEGECSREREKAAENICSSPLSSVMDEILFLIMMRLGLGDFAAFRGVCRRWRSFATLNMNMFMSTREPMSLSFSTVFHKKYCFLEDINERKFKTHLPHSTGRTCIGVTCGYLIFYGTKAYDFWLVNPITRHELHFPSLELDFPRFLITDPTVKGILVFSPSMSGLVFVLSMRFNTIAFCLAGKEARWNRLFCNFPINDIHFFQGKIYGLSKRGHFIEVQLNPKPDSEPVRLRILNRDFSLQMLASWGENLYVMGYDSEGGYGALAVDLWVRPKKTTEKYALFENRLKRGKLDLWVDPREEYENFGNFNGEVNLSGKLFDADMWYFPHDCSTVNRLLE